MSLHENLLGSNNVPYPKARLIQQSPHTHTHSKARAKSQQSLNTHTHTARVGWCGKLEQACLAHTSPWLAQNAQSPSTTRLAADPAAEPNTHTHTLAPSLFRSSLPSRGAASLSASWAGATWSASSVGKTENSFVNPSSHSLPFGRPPRSSGPLGTCSARTR